MCLKEIQMVGVEWIGQKKKGFSEKNLELSIYIK
jgi:hypothetical protein